MPMFRLKGYLLLTVPVLITIVCSYQSTSAQGGPPVITDDTETVPGGHWEINTAFTYERGSDGRFFGIPLLDMNYGLSKNTQLKVEVPWLLLRRDGKPGVHGLGNTNIGVRWRFRDEKEHHRIAMSVYPQFEFNNPTSSVRKGLVDRGPEFLMPLQLQTQVGKYGINGDVGYRFKRGPDELIYGVVVGRELNEAFELLGEVHGTGAASRLSQSEIVYDVGSRVKLSSHMTLLLSAGTSIRANLDPRFICYTGIQVTF